VIDSAPHSLLASAARPGEAGAIDPTPHSQGSAARPGGTGAIDREVDPAPRAQMGDASKDGNHPDPNRVVLQGGGSRHDDVPLEPGQYASSRGTPAGASPAARPQSPVGAELERRLSGLDQFMAVTSGEEARVLLKPYPYRLDTQKDIDDALQAVKLPPMPMTVEDIGQYVTANYIRKLLEKVKPRHHGEPGPQEAIIETSQLKPDDIISLIDNPNKGSVTEYLQFVGIRDRQMIFKLVATQEEIGMFENMLPQKVVRISSRADQKAPVVQSTEALAAAKIDVTTPNGIRTFVTQRWSSISQLQAADVAGLLKKALAPENVPASIANSHSIWMHLKDLRRSAQAYVEKNPDSFPAAIGNIAVQDIANPSNPSEAVLNALQFLYLGSHNDDKARAEGVARIELLLVLKRLKSLIDSADSAENKMKIVKLLPGTLP